MKSRLMTFLLLLVPVFLFACVSVSSVLGDIPVPVKPQPNPYIYLIAFSGEFLSLLVGVAVLSRLCKTRWQKALTTIAVAVIASYIIGITFWASGGLAGIPVYNPLVVSPENQPQFAGLVVTLLPEFVGTILGGFVIRTRQNVNWRIALLTMAAAMLTSWFLGSLLINLATAH